MMQRILTPYKIGPPPKQENLSLNMQRGFCFPVGQTQSLHEHYN
jgi:hypothetical protein